MARVAKEAVKEKAVRGKAKAEPAAKTTRTKKVEEEPVKKTRAKKVAEPEKAPTRTRTKKVEEPEAEKKKSKADLRSEFFNPLAHADDMMDAIEKHVGIADGGIDASEKRMSTGLLMQDVMLGGGITAGWYTNFGQEQSCKTTDALTIACASMGYDGIIRMLFDYEGSGQPDYVENISDTLGIKKKITEIFGVRDEKTGKYLVSPLIRYRDESVAEKFFDMLSQLLRKLPDKKKIGDNWYYLYQSKNKEGKLCKETAKIVGNKYDVDYFKRTGLYRIPAPDGSLQAVILLDSYPAMLPEVQDVDDPNDALAAQARMFSTQLRRVKGRMKGKRVAVIGINILREVPMAMYGPKEKEACGTALKQYSDVRVRHTSRALSGVPHLTAAMKRDAEGMVMSEKSVTVSGGKDHYRFIHIRADKNKLSRPYMEAWLRLWITDGKKKARGFDPVWDQYCYLVETGQAEGKIDKIKLCLHGKEAASKPLDWLSFKKLVLLPAKETAEIFESIGMKPIRNFRQWAFDQMASGLGLTLFNEQYTKVKEEEEKEIASGDESDA